MTPPTLTRTRLATVSDGHSRLGHFCQLKQSITMLLDSTYPRILAYRYSLFHLPRLSGLIRLSSI